MRSANGGIDLSNGHVRAVAASDRTGSEYYVFADGSLLRTGPGTTTAHVVAAVPNISGIAHGTGDGRLEGKDLEIRLYVHEPWVCVSERFGVNAALVNTETGSVRPLSRKDYHCDVSSYSIGFARRGGRVLLIAQSEWNRLDVFDAATGENLTEREVRVRDTGTRHERSHPIYEYQNYNDYFHSLLHVSPDSRHFLSNGWVWSPVDVVLAFSTQAFLDGWEATGARIQGSGYNWDRPCTFIDNDTFVLAMDDLSVDDGPLADDERSAYRYRQLAFFTVPDPSSADDADRWLTPTAAVACDVFPRNTYGEVKGELHHDPVTGCLVAMTEGNGTYLVSISGEVVDHLADISLGNTPAHTDFGSRYGMSRGWAYSGQDRLFYRWRDGLGVEEHRLPTPV